MFNMSDLDIIRTSIANKKQLIASALKQAIASEKASRHVANLSHELRVVLEDETYYAHILNPDRPLFTATPTRSVGTVDDINLVVSGRQTV